MVMYKFKGENECSFPVSLIHEHLCQDVSHIWSFSFLFDKTIPNAWYHGATQMRGVQKAHWFIIWTDFEMMEFWGSDFVEAWRFIGWKFELSWHCITNRKHIFWDVLNVVSLQMRFYLVNEYDKIHQENVPKARAIELAGRVENVFETIVSNIMASDSKLQLMVYSCTLEAEECSKHL